MPGPSAPSATRPRAKAASPTIAELVNGWGGVTLAYRRRLIDSPSYTLNHEEVVKALEEDIRFAEGLSPVAVEVDANGHAWALKVAGEQNGAKVEATLPARTILVAAGTQPNTVLAREDATHAFIDGKYFRALDEEGKPVKPERVCKPADVRVLMYRARRRPLHVVLRRPASLLRRQCREGDGRRQAGLSGADAHDGDAAGADSARRRRSWPRPTRDWRATVVRVDRLTPTIVEVVVEAPAAARNFEPGQFYRLQNYEARSQKVDGTLLAMEGLALTGAWVDKEKGLLSMIVLEMGGSSDLCALLKPGEPVILMGPTGTPTEIEPGETVVLVGGGLGNAVLFSIGQAFRKAGTQGALLRRLQEGAATATRSRRSRRRPTSSSGAATRRRASRRTGRRTSAFVGNIVEAMRRTRRASWASSRSRSATPTASSPSAPTA